MPKVDIGIACSAHQISEWWVPLFGNLLYEERSGVKIGNILAMGSALPDINKNKVISGGIAPATDKNRNEKTDANRVKIVEKFMEDDADYLFFVDDDTAFPTGTISQLLAHGRDFIGGLYYNPRSPFNPIAYMRGVNGLYQPIWDFPFGAVMQVDSIGMGCTLIHRSVFEKILAAYTVFQRFNGSIVAVPKNEIRDSRKPRRGSKTPDQYITRGYLRTRVTVVDTNDPTENRPFPFFAMEYGRTEDHHFCELCAYVGIAPWVDTSINCDHFKHDGTTRADYKKEFNESISEGRLEPS